MHLKYSWLTWVEEAKTAEQIKEETEELLGDEKKIIRFTDNSETPTWTDVIFFLTSLEQNQADIQT